MAVHEFRSRTKAQRAIRVGQSNGLFTQGRINTVWVSATPRYVVHVHDRDHHGWALTTDEVRSMGI